MAVFFCLRHERQSCCVCGILLPVPGPRVRCMTWAAPALLCEGDPGALLHAGWDLPFQDLPPSLQYNFCQSAMSTDLGARAPCRAPGQGCTWIPSSSMRLGSCAWGLLACRGVYWWLLSLRLLTAHLWLVFPKLWTPAFFATLGAAVL